MAVTDFGKKYAGSFQKRREEGQLRKGERREVTVADDALKQRVAASIESGRRAQQSRISALAQQAAAAEEQSKTTGSLLDRYNLSRARALARISSQRTQPGKEAGGFIGGIQRRLTELYDREEEKEPTVKAPESIVLGQMDRPYREAVPVEDERDFRTILGGMAGKAKTDFEAAMERLNQNGRQETTENGLKLNDLQVGIPSAPGGLVLGQMDGTQLPGMMNLPESVARYEMENELERLREFEGPETPEMTEARQNRIKELEDRIVTFGEWARDNAIAGWTGIAGEAVKGINAMLEPVQNLGADAAARLAGLIYGDKFSSAAQYNAEKIKDQPAIGGLYDWAVGPADRAAERAQATNEALGTGAGIGGEVLQNAVRQIPDAIIALMSGGASMADDALKRANMTFGGAGLNAAKNPNLIMSYMQKYGGAGLNAAKEMAKNPNFIMSYLQMYGGRYEDAVDGGADPYTAALTATITTLMNSAVEAGGGIEDLPFTKATVGEWVKMALEEGREEAVQQVIDQLGQKMYVDESIPWFSTEDERAVVNPGVLGRNALVGALAGGLIGGPGMALNSMAGDAKPKTEDYSGAPELSAEEAEAIGAAEKHPDIAPKEIRELAEEAAAAEMAEAREQEAAAAARTARETAVAAAAQRTGSEGQRRLVEQAAQAYGEDAGVFAAHYEGGDVEAYRRGFDAMYTAGQVGLDMDRLRQATSELARGLSDTAKQEIWQAGENSAVRTIAPGAKRMTTKKATSVQRKQFRVLEEIGKRYGYEFVIVDSIDSGRANAAYRTGGKRIVVAADAADGAIVQAGIHEMVHSIRSLDEDGYNVLESVVLDHLSGAEYFDLEYSIKERMDMYAKSGQALTREDAIEEIVAEAVPTFFTDRQAVSAFVAKNRTLAEKIRDFFVEFANEVRKIAEKYAVNNDRMEIAALLGKSDALTEIANTLSDALEMARDSADAPATRTDRAVHYETSAETDSAGQTEPDEEMFEANTDDPWYYTFSLKQDSDATTSEAFKKWFGDSKVVNEDGSPKVMYHGSTASFTVFDKRKAKSSGHFGRGFYFTDSDSHAGQYGNAYQVYLKIENPLESGKSTVTKTQVRKFLKAVAENEDDYSIENYGTYDIDEILKTVYKKDTFSVIYDVNMTAIGDMVEAVKLFNEVNGTNFDGIIVPTETVVFEPNQIKSATDNVGTFDPENPDIRFSLNNVSSVETALSEDQNLMLPEDVNVEEKTIRAQAAAALERGLTAKQNQQIDGIAKKILRQTESTYSQKDFSENVKRLIREYADGGATEETLRAVAEMAKKVIEQSRRADNTLRDQYADLRKKLRETGISLTETQKQEAANEAGSYNAYRKKLMGTVKLVNDGTSLDAIWGELSGQHPELFPADTGEGEMVGKLTDFMLLMKPRYENPYGMDMDGAAVELAMRIQGDVMGLIGAKDAAKAMYGTANKFRKQFEDDFKKSLAEQRQARVERFRQIAEDLRAAKATGDKAEQAKVMNRYRAAMRTSGLEDAYAEVRATYRAREEQKAENRRRNELRGRVTKRATELMNMLEGREKSKRVPTALQGLVLDVLNMLDINGARANDEGRTTRRAQVFNERLNDLRNFYTQVWESQSAGDAPEGLEGLMMTLSERNLVEIQEGLDALSAGRNIVLRDMTSEQLARLDDVLRNVKHTISTLGRLWRIRRFSGVAQLGDASIREMRQKGPQRYTEDSAAGIARDFAALDMLEPVSYGERLGRSGESVIQALLDGEKIKFARVRNAAEATQTMLRETGVTGYDIGKWREHVNVVRLSGDRSVRMTDTQLMSLYLTSRRAQGLRHLLGNGIRIHTDKKLGAQVQTYTLTEGDIAIISRMLNDKQRALADRMSRYLSTDVAKWGNDVTQRMYLYDAFTEQNYWPLTSDPNVLKTQEPEGERAFNAIVNAGFTKPLNRLANNPVIITDAFDVFNGHISEMASYAGYAEVMTDTLAWLNYRQRTDDGLIKDTVKASIESALGKNGVKYLTKLVQDINGARRGGDGTQLNKLLGNYKKAAVMGKIRVAIQQPMSIVRAAAEIGPGYLVGGLKADRDALAEMHRWSSLAWWKSHGNYEMGIGRSMDAILWGETSRKDEIIDRAAKIGALGLDPGAMDDWAWTRMWSAVKRETDRTRPELRKGSDEYFRAVAERFEYIMDRTQVVDTVMHRSDLMRSKDGLIKSLTSFKAEPTKAYNMLIRAVMDLGRNPKNRDAQVRMARTAAAFVSSAAATALATAFFDAFKNRDDDDPIWKYLTGGEFMKDLSEAFIGGFMDNANIAASVPILGEMLEAAQGRDVTMMQFEGIANIGNAAATFMDHFFGENAKKTTKWGAMKPAITTMSQLTGLPASGIIANAEALLRAFDPDLMRVKSEMAKLDDAYRVLYEAMKKGDSKKALSIRTQLAKGLHGNTPKNPKEIDTGIAHALAEHDERVMQAYNLRTAGNRTKELLALKKQIMADGFTDAQVTAAINYCESLLNAGNAEKDMEAQLTAKLFTSKDLFSAIRTGGAYDVNEIADYLESVSTASDPAKSIKNSVSGEFKQEYLELTDSGRTREAETLAGKLALVGIDEDDLAGWVKSDRYQRMRDAVDAGSTSEAKRYIDKLYESGASTSDVVSSLNGRYEEMYVSLMRSGKRTQANRLRETLQALGLFWKDGRTNYYRDEVLEKWLEEAE